MTRFQMVPMVPNTFWHQSEPRVPNSSFPFREEPIGTSAAGTSGTTQGAPCNLSDRQGNRPVYFPTLRLTKKRSHYAGVCRRRAGWCPHRSAKLQPSPGGATLGEQAGTRSVSSTELNVYKKGALSLAEKVLSRRGRVGIWVGQMDTDRLRLCVHPQAEKFFWLDVAQRIEPRGFPSVGTKFKPPRGAGESLECVRVETTWSLTRKLFRPGGFFQMSFNTDRHSNRALARPAAEVHVC
jgi:hypothetical protein